MNLTSKTNSSAVTSFLYMECFFCYSVDKNRVKYSTVNSSSLSLEAHSTRSFKSWYDCWWVISCVSILCPCLDDFVVQKPELSTPSICHAPGGEYFVEGETWNIDSCTQCTCHSGRVLCETEVCPPLLCQNPSRTQDSCCPQCTGNRRRAPGCAPWERLQLRRRHSVGSACWAPHGSVSNPVTSYQAGISGGLLPKFIPFYRPIFMQSICLAPAVTF